MRRLALVLSAVVTLTAVVPLAMRRANRDVASPAIHDITKNPASREVRAVLVDAFGPDASTIVVGVEDNVAVLSGEVTERATQMLAEQVAETADGIIVVHNFLELAPNHEIRPSTQLANDVRLRSQVSSELASTMPDISVDACDGVVLLRGELPDNGFRDLAVRMTEHLSGVTRVIDLVRVAWTGPVSAVPIARSATLPEADPITLYEGEK